MKSLKTIIKEALNKEIIKAAGILCIAEDTKKILIVKRGEDCPEPNTWCNPGGKYEDSDKDFKQTAIREFQEETGYEKPINKLKEVYVHQSPNLEFHNYVGVIDEEFTPKLLKSEVTNHKWVSLKELKQLPNKHFGLEELISELF